MGVARAEIGLDWAGSPDRRLHRRCGIRRLSRRVSSLAAGRAVHRCRPPDGVGKGRTAGAKLAFETMRIFIAAAMLAVSLTAQPQAPAPIPLWANGAPGA